jgi:hypothetical protein
MFHCLETSGPSHLLKMKTFKQFSEDAVQLNKINTKPYFPEKDGMIYSPSGKYKIRSWPDPQVPPVPMPTIIDIHKTPMERQIKNFFKKGKGALA